MFVNLYSSWQGFTGKAPCAEFLIEISLTISVIIIYFFLLCESRNKDIIIFINKKIHAIFCYALKHYFLIKLQNDLLKAVKETCPTISLMDILQKSFLIFFFLILTTWGTC